VYRHLQIPDVPQDEREAAATRFREAAARLRGAALECARAILEVERTGAHFREGAASIREFGERNGLSAQEARTCANLARAIERTPSIAEAVRLGTISVAAGAILGEVLRLPPVYLGSWSLWIDWAKTKDSRELRRLLEERRDEARFCEPVIPLIAYVPLAVKRDIHRARILAGRPLHQFLTLGQTLAIVFADWLRRNDPLETTPGKRRMLHTALSPRSRGIAAEVKRAVRERSGDTCIVPLCGNAAWVEFGHRVPHRDGSAREAGDLHCLCDYHNWLHETGDIRIGGTAEAPIVTDRYGRPLSEKRPSPFWGESDDDPIIPLPGIEPLPPKGQKAPQAPDEPPSSPKPEKPPPATPP
jgi:hypothetical protein